MSVRVDNSYIYKYLDEQHARDNHKSRGALADSKRKEIPFLATLLTGIAIIILCIGLAIYFANSYKKISQLVQTSNLANSNSEYLNNSTNSDEIIDIENILNSKPSNESNSKSNNLSEPNKEIESISENLPDINTETVRNYVIFDYVDFDKAGIKQIIIGRKYDEPNSAVIHSWCYVETLSESGFKNILYLIDIKEEKIKKEITPEIANSFGVSKEILLEAQSLCKI